MSLFYCRQRYYCVYRFCFFQSNIRIQLALVSMNPIKRKCKIRGARDHAQAKVLQNNDFKGFLFNPMEKKYKII